MSRTFSQSLSRLGLPLLIFGSVLLGATAVVFVLVTPDRFPVKIGDKTVRIADLEDEEKALLIRQAELQAEQETLAEETKSPVLHQLELLRESFAPAGTALFGLEQVRATFIQSGLQVVSLRDVSIDAQKKTMMLTGEIRDPGGRSMQLLAEFVDNLRAMPVFASVSEPEYQRIDQADGATVSPFSISITL